MDFDLEQFKVFVSSSLSQFEPVPNCALLVENDWDDWFKYSTQYRLFVFDSESNRTRIGFVKIGEVDMEVDQRRPDLPEEFEELEESFFSIGQDAKYYECLNKLGDKLRDLILWAMNDLAAYPELWDIARKQAVTQISLLRSVTKAEIEGQFRRMTKGGARLTEYHFVYRAPKRSSALGMELKMEFKVEPESLPPTNIHVIIGRNGVGKTHTLNLMTKALVGSKNLAAQSGRFLRIIQNRIESEQPFSNLVTVSFSAFDSFILRSSDLADDCEMEFQQVSLRRLARTQTSGEKLVAKSPETLAGEFVRSASECQVNAKSGLWLSALETLEADPIFAAANIPSFSGKLKDDERKKELKKIFVKMSSGHQIVLLSITRLVQLVQEKTLILLDEPECHLHPPLLSAFVRALSDLLTDRNGVAIIATHSPVVVQEVPKNCVWKLHRSGHAARAERPEIETFGENVGTLTREIFGFELGDSGFHQMLREVVNKTATYDIAVRKFDKKLGAEAKAILRSMFLRKEASNEEAL